MDANLGQKVIEDLLGFKPLDLLLNSLVLLQLLNVCPATV